MDALWIGIGCFSLLFGLIGSFLPIIPGPPLSYFGLLCLFFHSEIRDKISLSWVIFFGITMLVITIYRLYTTHLGNKKIWWHTIWSKRKYNRPNCSYTTWSRIPYSWCFWSDCCPIFRCVRWRTAGWSKFKNRMEEWLWFFFGLFNRNHYETNFWIDHDF